MFRHHSVAEVRRFAQNAREEKMETGLEDLDRGHDPKNDPI